MSDSLNDYGAASTISCIYLDTVYTSVIVNLEKYNHQSPRILNPEVFFETMSRKETVLGSPKYSSSGVFTYIWVV